MNAAELKLKLFRTIDSLDQKNLEEVYGILLNYFNGKDDCEEWENLSSAQQEGILKSLQQLENNEGLTNQQVMENIRRKYGDQ